MLKRLLGNAKTRKRVAGGGGKKLSPSSFALFCKIPRERERERVDGVMADGKV